MNWTAIVPLRQGQGPKARLSKSLSPSERIRLSIHMADAVVQALRDTGGIEQILLLSPAPPPASMPVAWRQDLGRGLNAELDILRGELDDRALLVIHGDLPLVGPDDIEAMIEGAEVRGHAFAPDRHGAGTNAAAIMPGRAFSFAFGEGSLARHLAHAPNAALIRRPGLAIDVDTPDDLKRALVAGFQMPLN